MKEPPLRVGTRVNLIAADVQGPERFLNCDALTYSLPWQYILFLTPKRKSGIGGVMCFPRVLSLN